MSEKSLEEKFHGIATEQSPWDDELDFISFELGYNLAQKEKEQEFKIIRKNLEEIIGKKSAELDEAIEVVRYYADHSNWESVKRVQWGEVEYLDATQEEEGGVVARKFLKARGE